MNKKRLHKAIKKALLDVKREEGSKYVDVPIKESYNDFMFTEPNDDISKRGRNLIFRLLTLRDKLNININDRTISISADLYQLKNTSRTSNTKYNDYFSLEIINKVGYILHYENKRFAFKDETVYDDTIEQINITFKMVNQQNFEELYHLLMRDTGLARESNLEDLLDN